MRKIIHYQPFLYTFRVWITCLLVAPIPNVIYNAMIERDIAGFWLWLIFMVGIITFLPFLLFWGLAGIVAERQTRIKKAKIVFTVLGIAFVLFLMNIPLQDLGGSEGFYYRFIYKTPFWIGLFSYLIILITAIWYYDLEDKD